MGKYGVLLFDLDGTLIDIEACEADAFRKALLESGAIKDMEVSWGEAWRIYSSVNRRNWHDAAKEGLGKEVVVECIMRETLAGLGLDQRFCDSLQGTYWRVFLSEVILMPGARETLDLLKDSYACGLVTNGYADVQRARIGASGFAECFGAIAISGEVEFSKPDPRIFEVALRELGCRPSEALFIGDSVKDDYTGALNAGIDFCLFDPAHRNPVLDPEPVLRIVRLGELVECLATT